jgi:hypothetical protein
LTLRNRQQQLRTLTRILDKHGVQEPQKARLLDVQTRWLGRPEDIVRAEQKAAAAGTGAREPQR